jgi:hypothetical protein
VEAIERHLGARRGATVMLSPRDFDLARRWFAAGIPLARVLAGIDEARPNGPLASLHYCKHLVEAKPGDERKIR